MVLLQNTTDEGNADAITKLRELVEGFADDFRKAPVPKKILVKLLEFRLPVVQGEVLVDRIGELMKLFVKGRIAFPFGFFHERVDHFLDERRLKPQLHFRPP